MAGQGAGKENTSSEFPSGAIWTRLSNDNLFSFTYATLPIKTLVGCQWRHTCQDTKAVNTHRKGQAKSRHMWMTHKFLRCQNILIYILYNIYIYYTHTHRTGNCHCAVLGKTQGLPLFTLALFDIKTKLNQKTMLLSVNLIYTASLTMLDCIPTLVL